MYETKNRVDQIKCVIDSPVFKMCVVIKTTRSISINLFTVQMLFHKTLFYSVVQLYGVRSLGQGYPPNPPL